MIMAGILMACSINALSQGSYDSSFRFYYYDQKLSMFEIMPDRENEIVWLGDSITDGGEWSELFQDYTTLNRGISADNTFGILYRLHEITRRKPKKLFILIGINDISKNVPASIILGNYLKIIQQVKKESPATEIHIQSLFPTNNEFNDFPKHQQKTDIILKVNEGLKQLSAAEKTGFIDLYTPFADESGKLAKKYTNDGLHLTGEGYRHWKEVLIKSGAIR